MKNKKMLAMLLALTVTAAGTPVYAADFSDGNLESVQEAAEPEKILTGDTALEEDSNFMIITSLFIIFFYRFIVTVHTPLSREVFWHGYAKIPRHTSQNSIATGNLE